MLARSWRHSQLRGRSFSSRLWKAMRGTLAKSWTHRLFELRNGVLAYYADGDLIETAERKVAALRVQLAGLPPAPAVTARSVAGAAPDARQELRERLVSAGGESAFLGTVDFAAFLKDEQGRWARFVEAAIGSAESPRERAVRLFYAVRDRIRYDPFVCSPRREDYRASAVAVGYCQNSTGDTTRPSNSDSSPAGKRRNRSIWNRRSWAWAKPRPNAASRHAGP
jgi:hypothetical protein